MIVNIKKRYEDRIIEIINSNPDSTVRIKPTVSQVVHQALDDMFENFLNKKSKNKPSEVVNNDDDSFEFETEE